jgi:hypothetical protein
VHCCACRRYTRQQEYEEAYLLACTRDHSARACTCSMEALEDKVGFTRFAEEVDQHREDFLEESDLADMATDLVAHCKAISGLTDE